MGNASKKLAAKCTLLTKEEQKYVANTFRAASKNSEKIREDDLIVSGHIDAESLERVWGSLIDPRLAQYLINFLFGWGSNKAQTVDFNRFAELYVYNVRGTIDERLMVTYNSLGEECEEHIELTFQLLKEYCESLSSTFLKLVKSSNSRRAQIWISKGFRGRPSYIQALGEGLAATAGDVDNPQTHYRYSQIRSWLQSNILLQQMAEMVFISLYGIPGKEGDEGLSLDHFCPTLLPLPAGLEAMPDYPAFTDLAHIVWINSQIPLKHRHKWRFLFSSHIHGESFSTMAGRIQSEGPSVVIIQDNNGYIFGGYASESWEMNSHFYGNEESFLFTCAPKMRVYQASTYNNHYQYLNHHTKTLPNGLMMGGQFEFGGIWVNADPFGEGSSAESCITYRGYKRLSKDPTFRIKSMEVWAVGDKPLTLKDSDERDVSILDTNPEAKAILEMAGKSRHSDGVREPPS